MIQLVICGKKIINISVEEAYSMFFCEAYRVPDETMFVFLNLHYFLGLNFRATIVMDDANATTELKEKDQQSKNNTN